jgi:S-layer protein
LTATGNTGDTLIGGAGGHDTLIANAGLDTLTGHGSNETYVITTASSNSNAYATITDAHVGDSIQMDVGNAADTFSAAAITLAATAVFQDYANAAVHNSVAHGISWFEFGGNTYVVENLSGGTSFVNGTDHIVQLTGLVDLTHTSLNSTHGTLLIG